MSRRTSRPRPFRTGDPVPDGWRAHDGRGLPIAADSCPALLFRMGTRVRPGVRPATYWGGSWEWKADSREPMDIVAFCEEKSEPTG